MKVYSKPQIEITEFVTADIITTSNGLSPDNSNDSFKEINDGINEAIEF